MDIHRIDPVIVDDRAQPRTGERDLSMRVFSLEKISMVSGCKSIFSEIIQAKQGTKADTTHSAHQCTFLCIYTIREDPLMPGKMQGFVFVGIVSFLENGYIVCTAFVEICILI